MPNPDPLKAENQKGLITKTRNLESTKIIFSFYQEFSPVINCDDVATGNRPGPQDSRHAPDGLAHKGIF